MAVLSMSHDGEGNKWVNTQNIYRIARKKEGEDGCIVYINPSSSKLPVDATFEFMGKALKEHKVPYAFIERIREGRPSGTVEELILLDKVGSITLGPIMGGMGLYIHMESRKLTATLDSLKNLIGFLPKKQVMDILSNASV